jgi:hypothetical protein
LAPTVTSKSPSATLRLHSTNHLFVFAKLPSLFFQAFGLPALLRLKPISPSEPLRAFSAVRERVIRRGDDLAEAKIVPLLLL